MINFQLEITDGKVYIKSTLVYIFQRAGFEENKKIANFLTDQVSKPLGDEAMTLAEYFRSEGEVRGEAKGEAKGEANAQRMIATNMLREGASIDFIAKVTQLTIEDVQSLAVIEN